jgi:hypothetical protein
MKRGFAEAKILVTRQWRRRVLADTTVVTNPEILGVGTVTMSLLL